MAEPVKVIEREFWRGFAPLLANFLLAVAGVQLDMSMVTMSGAGALAAFALITRVAVVDFAIILSAGTISGLIVANAKGQGEAAQSIGEILILSFLIGTGAAVIGVFVYPKLIGTRTTQRQINDFIHAAIFWHVAATPLRTVASAINFALHALGHGTSALAAKLLEFLAKATANVFLIASFGFTGCFIASIVAATISIGCGLFCLRGAGALAISPGNFRHLGFFLRACLMETTRSIGPQLCVFVAFGLLALPWPTLERASRIDAYAAVQTLVLLAMAPLLALTRFFALRFAGRPEAQVKRFITMLWRQGMPVSVCAGATLFFARDWISLTFYRLNDAWWSTLIAAFAMSLPLRYGACLLRGALLARKSFGVVARIDGFAPWLIALPFVGLGLFLNQPVATSLSLLAPEAVCAALLARKLARAFAVDQSFEGAMRR